MIFNDFQMIPKKRNKSFEKKRTIDKILWKILSFENNISKLLFRNF